MSPSGVHAEHRAALDQLGRALAAVLASAAERQADATSDADSAGDCRPLAGGDHPMQHEDRVQLWQAGDAAFEEDDRHALTSTDA